jgi:peptide/nickel transport system substrate-binding protein
VEYVVIGAKEVLERDGELGQDPVGTGAFRLADYVPGSTVTLDRFDEYFESELPYLDRIVYNIIADRRTALEAFLAEDLDMLYALNEQGAEISSRMGDNAVVSTTASNARNHLFLNSSRPPFNDPRVRQALSIAASRADHAALVYGGFGREIGGYMAPGPEGVWSLPEERIRAIRGYGDNDLAEARALLEAAGIAEGTELEIVSRNIYETLAVFVTETLRQLGLNGTPRLLDTAEAYAAGASGQFDILPWTAVPPLDDPDAVLGDIGWSGASRNWSFFDNARVDELYLQQSRTLDVEERREMVNEIDATLLENYASIVMGYNVITHAHRAQVKNKSYHFGESYYNRSYTDIWLDS